MFAFLCGCSVNSDTKEQSLLSQADSVIAANQDRLSSIGHAETDGINDPDFAQKAFIISQSFVKQELRSPTTADFPFDDYSYSNVKDNTVTIKSYVDAQNSFGAELRNNYVIVLRKLGSDWSDINNWEMVSLRFE